MAWTAVRNYAVAIAFVLVGVTAARAQTSISAREQPVRTTNQQDLRITLLLIHLADQARLSDDLTFAVRAQSQAATLLWSADSDRARTIYRQAFRSLTLNGSSKTNDSADNSRAEPRANLSVSEKQQLRAELLNQIAARDPELAEELARSLAEGVENSKEGCSTSNCDQGNHASTQALAGSASTLTQADVDRRELLISVALQVVERDPQRAMALGQLSLASGVSQNFSRLLTLMRAVEPAMADLLFSCALARLGQSPSAQLADIHTLGTYLVTVVNSGAKQTLSRTDVEKFLRLAFNQILRRAESSSFTRAVRPDESAAIYFIQRQLADLFARYLPERSDQLLSKLVAINDDGTRDQGIDPASLRPSPPLEIAREARDATDDRERDSLNAGAALAWLNKGDVREAQVAALKISDAQMRDRVIAQLVRRYAADAHIEDAVAMARRIEATAARIDALVLLSGAALASGDRARATELLNEAEGYAIKSRPSEGRARSLLKVVSSFSAFDSVRGFEVMQTAVKAINDISGQPTEEKPSPKSVKKFRLDELYDANFESTLAVLARADFERALLLAQQLDVKETSLAAQLAVCHGGLANELRKEQAQAESGIGSGERN
ncbi:MAG: hypothetical protein WBV94_16245 [Blastocatellia bacterium]